jgi:hypothetical protein
MDYTHVLDRVGNWGSGLVLGVRMALRNRLQEQVQSTLYLGERAYHSGGTCMTSLLYYVARCSLVTVLTLAVASCAVPQRTYPVYAPTVSTPTPPLPPESDRTESAPHMTIRLTRITPPGMAIPDAVIEIERTYTVKSTYIGTYTGWSTFRSSRFSGKGTILAAHRDVQFGFGVTSIDLSASDLTSGPPRASTSPLALSVLVRNSSPSGITLDWNAVTLIAASGRAYPVIHKGVKMADRGGASAPSTVPPSATLEDFVYPRELISFSSSRYDSSWLGSQFLEIMEPRSSFTLYMPIRHGDQTTEYQFIFEAGEPLQRG